MKTENLQNELWAWVRVPGAKNHFCPRQLVGALVTELEQRVQKRSDIVEKDAGYEIEVISRARGCIDLPGMIMGDRPIETIRIDTFDLCIPSQDFDYFVEELETVPLRKFSDGRKYYKIHGWMVCVVFTVDQRDLVLKTMREMLPEVLVRAEVADRRFSQGIQELNDKARMEGRGGVISQRDKYSAYAPTRIDLGKISKDKN